MNFKCLLNFWARPTNLRKILKRLCGHDCLQTASDRPHKSNLFQKLASLSFPHTKTQLIYSNRFIAPSHYNILSSHSEKRKESREWVTSASPEGNATLAHPAVNCSLWPVLLLNQAQLIQSRQHPYHYKAQCGWPCPHSSYRVTQVLRSCNIVVASIKSVAAIKGIAARWLPQGDCNDKGGCSR